MPDEYETPVALTTPTLATVASQLTALQKTATDIQKALSLVLLSCARIEARLTPPPAPTPPKPTFRSRVAGWFGG